MEVFAFADDFGKLSSHMAGSSMMMMGCLRRCSLGRWNLDECSRVRCNHLARETDSRALARLSHDSTKEWRFKCVAPGYLSARRPGGQVKRYPMNAETSPKQVSCGPPKEETSAGVPKMQSLALRIGGMTCDHCPPTIEKAIANIRGVSAAKVNAAIKIVRIE